jgi:hypothetical protein
MKRLLVVLSCGLIAVGTLAFAATPQQEKHFVDAYKKAHEGKGAKGRTAMLYTKGADPQGLR